MKRGQDTLTRDMFLIPQPAQNLPGSLSCRAEIANTMSDALKGLDRYEVAARMSRLLDREISKHILDAYTAESREDHIPPIDTAIAFDVATDGFALINLYSSKLGARIMVGKDALGAEIVKLERVREEAAKKIKQLKSVMGADDE